MAEQQLIDYIKKAREANQSDSQTRDLLYKNGWTPAEVDDAVSAIEQAVNAVVQPQAQPEPMPKLEPKLEPEPMPSATTFSQPNIDQIQQSQFQPQTQPKPEIQTQTQTQIQPEPQPEISVQKPNPQPLASSYMDVDTRVKTKSNVFGIFIILIVSIIVLGAGYFVAAQYLNIPFSAQLALKEDPNKVIGEMVKNMADNKIRHSVSQVEISALNNDTRASQFKFLVNADTKVDLTNTNNVKATGNFSANLTTSNSVPPIEYNANLSTIFENNIAYINLNSFSPISLFSQPGLPDISKNIGKWLTIDKNSVEVLSKQTDQAVALDVSSLEASDLTQKIQNLIGDQEFFTVDKQLADETISGQQTYHYSLLMSNAKLKNFVTILIGSTLPNEVQTYINGAVDKFGNISMDVWIGKKDKMLYQFKINKSIDLSQLTLLPATLELKIQNVNSDFNKPFTIQLPENPQKIEDATAPIINALNVSDNLIQVGGQAENLLSTYKNYYLLCKNGFLNGSRNTSYGLEFIRIANATLKLGAKNPSCFSSLTGYCVSTQLKDGSFMCIDKNGIGTAKCENARTICNSSAIPQ